MSADRKTKKLPLINTDDADLNCQNRRTSTRQAKDCQN